MTRRMTRRELLRVGGLGSMVALLAACQPKVVEKIVEKEVTKIIKEVVKETIIVEGTPQVVEREVTRVVEATKAPEATAAPPGRGGRACRRHESGRGILGGGAEAVRG